MAANTLNAQDELILNKIKDDIEKIYDKAKSAQTACKKYSLEADNRIIQVEKLGAQKKVADSEMEIPLKEMGTILSRLKGRKVEIQEYMKKIMDPRKIEAQLDEVFERLKSTPLNQKLLQLADGISENLQTKEPIEEENKDFELTNYIPQYDTLFSFVNSEQVDELKNSSLKHYTDLQAKTLETIKSLDTHTSPIEEPLKNIASNNSNMTVLASEIAKYSTEIKEAMSKLEELIKEIEIQYNRIRDTHAVQAINKNATVPVLVDSGKQFRAEDEKAELSLNESRLKEIEASAGRVKKNSEVITETIAKYDQLFKELTAEQKSISTIRANIKKSMQNIEKLFKEFEELYRRTDEECCELLSLVDWYTNFEYMHKELFAELNRRIKAETEIEEEVEQYRAALKDQFEQEVKQRKKFADELLTYLPTPLLPLVAEHPIKYQVYPISKKSALFSLAQESPDLFHEGKGGSESK